MLYPHPLEPNISAKIKALQLSTLNPSPCQFHISTPGWGPGTFLSAWLWVRTPLGAFFWWMSFMTISLRRLSLLPIMPRGGSRDINSTQLKSHRFCSFLYQMDQADVSNAVDLFSSYQNHVYIFLWARIEQTLECLKLIYLLVLVFFCSSPNSGEMWLFACVLLSSKFQVHTKICFKMLDMEMLYFERYSQCLWTRLKVTAQYVTASRNTKTMETTEKQRKTAEIIIINVTSRA